MKELIKESDIEVHCMSLLKFAMRWQNLSFSCSARANISDMTTWISRQVVLHQHLAVEMETISGTSQAETHQ